MTYRYMCKIKCTQVNPNGAGAGAIGIQQLRSRSYILIGMCSGAGAGAASYLGLLRSPANNTASMNNLLNITNARKWSLIHELAKAIVL